MSLADNPSILDRPVGFAVGINREGEIDVDVQRTRLPGLLRFVRTFTGELLEKEFGTEISGYPHPAREKTQEVRVKLRDEDESSETARRLLAVLVDLMDLEADHDEASPENDPEEQEDFHDAILTFVQRLLDRFASYASQVEYLPNIAKEAQRGSREFAKAAAKLTR